MVASLLFMLNSCEKGDNIVKTVLSGYMTGVTDSLGYIKELVDDMGNRYTLLKEDESEQYSPDTIVRMVVAVELDDDKRARITSHAYPLSYRAPADAILPDSLRVHHPTKIESLYIGGGYLNINVEILVSKENTKHLLLYSCTDNSTPNITFQLYHNSYGDGRMYTKRAYISIPLSGYGLSHGDTVRLNCNGYYGLDYGYELIYR